MISEDELHQGGHRDGIATGGGGKSSQCFINAKDLVDLRELQETLVHHAIGEKSYMPSDEKNEDESLMAFMEGRKARLKIQKASTIGSLIFAEWNADSQKAVTKKLEGKFSQHVGKSSEGKIMLSPEETLFLLENESLELHYGGRPISIEEAHSLMITSNYANLRYLVYVHLSLLGYTVVLHQGKIDDITPYEKKMNLAKQKIVGSKKRKRKSASMPRKKVVLHSNHSSIKESNACDVESEGSKEGRCKKPCVSATILSERSPCMIKSNDEVVVTEVEETETINPILLEAVKETADVSVDIVVSKNQNVETSVCAVDKDSKLENRKELDISIHEEKAEVNFSTSKTSQMETSPENGKPVSDKTKESESVEQFDSEIVVSDDCHIVVDATEKCEIRKIEISNEQCIPFETNIGKTFESSESGDEKEIERAKDQPEEEEYENESTASETNSNDSIVRIDTENDSLDCMDADVEIVTVTKKEKTPLAVINLSDDENEENIENSIDVKQNNNDDDDIQIIEECSPSVTLSTKSAQASQGKKPKYVAPKVDVDFNKAVIWPFPNLLKKTLACLPRPPPHLMPNNVRLTKEAYTLDLRKLSGIVNSQQPTPRVWNSYKDLQLRRRSSAVGNSGFRGSPWNIPPDQQPFSPQHGHFHGMHNDWNRGAGSPQSISPTFIRGNEMNSNPTLISRSPPTFVKSENSSVPPPFGNPHVSAPVFHGIPQENFSQFVSMAATQAAVQAARNVIMSMTGNMNVTVDCQTNPLMPAYNSDNISFPGALGGAPFLGNPMVNNVAIGQNSMEVMHDDNRTIGNHQEASQFSDPIHTSQPRTRDSPRDLYQPRHVASASLPYNANIDDFYRPAVSGTNVRSFQMRSSTNGCNPYPSDIPKGPKRVSSWREYKSAVTNSDLSSNDADDVMEVPINLAELLWSKHLSPLTRSEIMKSSYDILKCSQITLPARLIKGNVNERFMPTSCSLEIAFDVYLPNSIYKKTSPDVPSLRIVVVDAQDPFPKLGDIVFLARKFQDSAPLIFAVVDDKDISYFSFVFMDLPELLPE